MSAVPESGVTGTTRPPSGTVTFAFTDIEGSTVRWERHSAAMETALRRHDELVRASMAAHGGHVFKTIGDAFCVAFGQPQHAVEAMLATQRALAAADFSSVGGIRVRAAVHTGTADERDGDYFGPTVNRVARLLSIGHGGQILISGATAELIRSDLPEHAGLRSLGAHQLKDLARPEHVHQLLAPDVSHDFPPLRSLSAASHNLPHKLTSLVGREPDVAELATLIGHHRLVTIVGAGGVGKTRTSLQVAATVAGQYADGVWFIELAPLTTGDSIPATIAQAMSLNLDPGVRTLDESLFAGLKDKNALLVLDNCEHLLEPTAKLASEILRRCPRVSVLASSRQGLGIDGEQRYRLPSLDVRAAVALFIDRARAVDKRFILTAENNGDVEEVCRRLDGIPLAIELAAPRIKILSPHRLLERLNERFRVLTGGSNDALPRQQTLRATIEWSFDLLSEREQRFLCRLAVFAGTFTLDAAGPVAGEGHDELDVLELAGDLVDKSLVAKEARFSDAEARFRLSETVRAFGLERLDATGERTATMQRYSGGVLTFLERVSSTWERTPLHQWLQTVEPEIDNVRDVLQWTLDSAGDVELGQRIAGASRRFWGAVSPLEGTRWVAHGLARLDERSRPEIVAGLTLADAQMRTALQQHAAAYASAARALALYESTGADLLAAEARGFAGLALAFLGRPEDGMALLQRALDDYERLGSQHFLGHAYSDLGLAHAASGDLQSARHFLRKALSVFHTLEYDRETTSAAGNLAEIEFWSGDTEAAVRICREAISGTADQRSLGMYTSNLAAYYVALDRWDEACEAAYFVLDAPAVSRADLDLAFAIQHVAAVAALAPRASREATRTGCERAAILLGAVDAWLERMDNERQQSEQREYDRIEAATRTVLGAADYERLRTVGRMWNERRAIAEAAATAEASLTKGSN